MAIPLRVKRGDTAPLYRATLLDGSTPVDLTGATVRLFVVHAATGDVAVDAAATIDADPTTGRVSYAWGASDLSRLGHHSAEWEVTYSNSSVQTFPGAGYLAIEVGADLGDAP